jgi:hypothetical protein
MQKNLLAAGVLFAIYKFAPNQMVKVMALGVAGVLASQFVPYVNGKTPSETLTAIKGA